MSDFLQLNEARIPTERQNLLNQVTGKVITQFFRFSFDSFEEFKALGTKSEIEQSDFFQKAAGPCVLRMSNGFTLGFTSDESMNSILVWLETDGENTNPEYEIFDDEEYILLNARGIEFTKPVINQKVKSIKILKQNPESSKYETLPNEVGVQFELENGEFLIMSHNLIRSIDSFAVGFRDEIAPEILAEIMEIEIK